MDDYQKQILSVKETHGIVDHLRREIENKNLRCGERLPGEMELCRLFSANRATIRKVLSTLEYIGLIEKCRKGYCVSGHMAYSPECINKIASKIALKADSLLTIQQLKRIFMMGLDGLILPVTEKNDWKKNIRAVQQAAHDCDYTPALIAEVDGGYCHHIDSVLLQQVDFLYIYNISDVNKILPVRKIIEDYDSKVQLFVKFENQDFDVEEFIKLCDGVVMEYSQLTTIFAKQHDKIFHECRIYGKPIFVSISQIGTVNWSEFSAAITKYDFDGCFLCFADDEQGLIAQWLAQTQQMLQDSEADLAPINSKYSRIISNQVIGSLCSTAVHAARAMNSEALLVPSDTGFIPRILSKFRIEIPIIAISANTQVVRQLRMVRGVYPLRSRNRLINDDVIQLYMDTALQANYVHHGDRVVVVVGHMDVLQARNAVYLMVVGDIIVKGQGIGQGVVSGRVVVIKNFFDIKRKVKNRIVVIKSTDAEHMRIIEEAAGLIVEDGGLSSHAAIACLALRKPVIVGAEQATELLMDDEPVTMDVMTGAVYQGWVNLG